MLSEEMTHPLRGDSMSLPKPDLREEMTLYGQGYHRVAGLDEAGRGSWAGPVAAGAVVLPLGNNSLKQALDGVRDSKQLNPSERERLYDVIQTQALAVGVGMVPPNQIDELGIVPATKKAMALAIAQLPLPPDFLLIDFLGLPQLGYPQKSIVHGDALSLSIAAASIVAKVSRDRFMIELDGQYPSYGFASHKGYGTPRHRAALDRLGPSSIHRFSYAPVRAAMQGRKLTAVGSNRFSDSESR
jgi:ribonuclease HII